MLGCSMLGAVRFEWHEMWQSPIFLNLRLPRIILAVLVGASLSVCGAAYQSIFRNPLTDPYVLGISSGAKFVVALMMIFVRKTAFGTFVESVGINRSASRLSGINAKLVIFIVFALTGVLSGISGMIYATAGEGGVGQCLLT